MTRITFDDWTLVPATGELLRGDTKVRLQEQPLQVLIALLSRPGQLITRDELIALLWPADTVAFDVSLNTVVRKVRIALGDDADRPRYIETIPRRGYRFIGGIVSHADDSLRELKDDDVPSTSAAGVGGHSANRRSCPPLAIDVVDETRTRVDSRTVRCRGGGFSWTTRAVVRSRHGNRSNEAADRHSAVRQSQSGRG